MSEFINTVDVLGDDAVCDGIITKTLTEYLDNTIVSIGEYALYNCTALINVNLPIVTSIGLFGFYSCSSLKTANLSLVELIDNYAFYNCLSLESIYIPLVANIGKSAFYGCSKISSIDIPSVTSIDAKAFNNCSLLATVILRNETMCKLIDIDTFTNTPITDGTGYIYVPSALVETYTSDTNWSVYSHQIRAIEDYTDIVGG